MEVALVTPGRDALPFRNIEPGPLAVDERQLREERRDRGSASVRELRRTVTLRDTVTVRGHPHADRSLQGVLVPVVCGLGLFMLGLELMSDGIQKLAVNRMRDLLAKIAGTLQLGYVPLTLPLIKQIERYWASAFQAGG